jgi:hypothetical protein
MFNVVMQNEKGYGVPGVSMRTGVSSDLKRGSIKRQSDIMREARKSRQEEHEEERKRKQSYYRRVTGEVQETQLMKDTGKVYSKKQILQRRVTGER